MRIECDKPAFSFKLAGRSAEILKAATTRHTEGGKNMPGGRGDQDPSGGPSFAASLGSDILPDRGDRASKMGRAGRGHGRRTMTDDARPDDAPAPVLPPAEPIVADMPPASHAAPSYPDPIPVPPYPTPGYPAPAYPALASAGAPYPGYSAPPAPAFARPGFPAPQPGFPQPGVSQPGVPQPGFPQPAFPQGGFPQGGFATALPFAPPSTGRKVGLVVGLSVAGVVGVAVLAAIAIPVFLGQQKPKPVTLTLPPTLEGSAQLTTGAAQQAASAMSTQFGNATTGYTTDLNTAVYKGPTSFLITTAKLTRRPTPADRNSFVTNFAKGAAGQASAVSMAKVPPGPLGGSTECGLTAPANSVPAVVCVSIDDSAIVFVAVYTDDLVSGTMLATELRGDVEHK